MNVGDKVIAKDNEWVILETVPAVKIKVIKVGSLFNRYIDVGKEYTLNEHTHAKEGDLLYLGEIPKEQMRRSFSQVLLYEWKDSGLSMDLDS